MARRFLPALRGLVTDAGGRDAADGVEGKSLSLGGYASTTHFGRSGVMYGSQGRADAWDLDVVISEGYERSVWVFRCVELIAGHAARLPFMAGKGIGTDQEEVLESHALYRVMNKRANPLEKAYAFRKRLSAQLLLSKRGVFVEVLKSRAGTIVRLDLLDPSRVRPIEDPDGDYIQHFEYTRRDGVVREIDPSRIRWIREPHPTDPFSGVTPLEAAGMSVELDFLSRYYNNSFIKNDSRPGGILGIDSDSLTDQEMDRIERKFQPGVQHAGEMTVVGTGPGGLRYLDTTTKPRDMAYEHASQNSKQELLAAFGIGESLLGSSGGRTYENAESELYNFWTQVMPPHLALIASAFDEDIDGWDPFFKTSGIEVLELPRRRDREEARNEFAQGLRSIDEYRPVAKLPVLNTPQTRALWVSPSKAPVPGRPEDAAALGLGMGGDPGMDGGMPPADGPPAPAGGGTAVEAVEEARAVAAGEAETVDLLSQGAVGAVAAARAGDDTPGGDAAAAVEEASIDYSGTATGDASNAVRSARRMMQRKSLPDGTVIDVDTMSVDGLTMSVKAAVDGLLARQRGVIAARLASPKTRKGTRFWTPDGPEDTRGGPGPVEVRKVIDPEQWERETFEAVAPLTMAAAGRTATALHSELDELGMVAGTVTSDETLSPSEPWRPAAVAGAFEASEMVRWFVDQVAESISTSQDSADDMETVISSVGDLYERHAPQLAEDVAAAVARPVLETTQDAVVMSLAPAPGRRKMPAKLKAGGWVIPDDAAGFIRAA